MPLAILGFVFVVGLFIYYLISTSGSDDSSDDTKKKKKETKSKENDEGNSNVIFLPTDIEKAKKSHHKNK